jgi:hypothetical protein
MKTIKIGNESKSYNEIIYVNSNSGSDSLGNGSKLSPFKTINKGIAAAPEGGAVVIDGVFEGKQDNTGFVRIDKSIDIIGNTKDSGKNLPVIKSLDHNTVQLAANNLEVNFYQVRLESYGNSTGPNVNSVAQVVNVGYSTETNSPDYTNSNLTFHNCIILPKGKGFVMARNNFVEFYNSLIDYSGHHFYFDISFNMTNEQIIFDKCIEIGSYTSDHSNSNSAIFKNGIYSEDKVGTTYKSSILEPNIQVDENYDINYPEWIKNDDPMNNAFFTFQEEVNSNIPSNVIDISYDKESGKTYFYCGAETYEYDGNSFILLENMNYPYLEKGFLCKTEESDFQNTNILNENIAFKSIGSDDLYFYAGSDTGDLYIYNKELILQEKINVSSGMIRNIKTNTDYIVFSIGEYLYVYDKYDFTLRKQFEISDGGGLGGSLDIYNNKLIYHTQSNVFMLDLETLETIDGSHNEGVLLYRASDHVRDLHINKNLLYVSVGGSSFSNGQIDVYNLDSNINNERVINMSNTAFRNMKVDDNYLYAFSTEKYNLSVYNVENGIPTSIKTTINDSDEQYFSPTNITSYEDYFCFTEGKNLYVYSKTDFSLVIKTPIFNSYPYGDNSIMENNVLYLPTSSGIEYLSLTKPQKNPLKSILNKKLLTCGSYDSITPVQETWQLDPVTPAWNQLSPSVQPPARMDHEFKGDILFGGHDGNGNYFNDTWKWDEETLNWIEVTTATKPPARANFAMTEAEDGNVYIYGGENSEGLLNDFWMFNGSDWIEVVENAKNIHGIGFEFINKLIDTPSGIYSVFSDNEYIYAGLDSSLYIYDKKTLNLIKTITDNTISYEDITSDENYIYIAGDSQNSINYPDLFKIYNKSDFSLHREISDPTSGGLYSVYTDSNYVYIGGGQQGVVYNKNNFTEIGSSPLNDPKSVVSTIFSDDSHIYVGGWDKNVYVYNKLDFTLMFTLSDSTNYIRSVYADDNYLYVGSRSGNTYVYNKHDFKLNIVLTDAASDVRSVYADNKYLYAASGDFKTYIYNKPNFELNTILTNATNAANSVYVDSNYVYIGSYDSNLYIYKKSKSGRINSSLTQKLLILGGKTDDTYHDDIYQYDKESKQFINRGQFSDQPSARESVKVADLPSNETLLVGGEDSVGQKEDMFKLKPIDVGVYAGLYSWLIFKSNILIEDSGQKKTFDLGSLTWKPIKGSVKTKGITDLGNLIQNTTKSIKAPKTTTTETGSQFSKPVNLKSFKTISNISII